jgi:hypothetical protein
VLEGVVADLASNLNGSLLTLHLGGDEVRDPLSQAVVTLNGSL